MKTLTDQQKADNAIKWVDALASGEYKQAPLYDRGRLGNSQDGFCCLGVGCHLLAIEYLCNEDISREFTDSVGLLSDHGSFIDSDERFFDQSSLVGLNDDTEIGFITISALMMTRPDLMFEKNVAEIIKSRGGVK